jgi:predicted small secreted protein
MRRLRYAAGALILSVLLVFLSGCETAKGVGQVGTGFVKDCKSGWESLTGLDGWLRKNAW